MVIGLLDIWDGSGGIGCEIRDCVEWIKKIILFGNILESELLNKTVI